jgi:hypothetical protein
MKAMSNPMPAHERHRTDRIGWLRAAVLGAIVLFVSGGGMGF